MKKKHALSNKNSFLRISNKIDNDLNSFVWRFHSILTILREIFEKMSANIFKKVSNPSKKFVEKANFL